MKRTLFTICVELVLVIAAVGDSLAQSETTKTFIEKSNCDTRAACSTTPRSVLVLYKDATFAVVTTYYDQGKLGFVVFQPSEGCVVRWGTWEQSDETIIAKNVGRWAHMAVGKPTSKLSLSSMHWKEVRDRSTDAITSLSVGKQSFEPISLQNFSELQNFIDIARRGASGKRTFRR